MRDVHPQNNFTLPMQDDLERPIDDDSEQLTPIDFPPDLIVPDVKNTLDNKYIPSSACSMPILPSNKTIQFTPPIIAEIKIFRDMNNDTRTRIIAQRLAETKLVESGSCSTLNPDIVRDFRFRTFSIDDSILDAELSGTNSLNANVHDDVACFVDSIIYNNTNLSGRFVPLMRERIRNWFPYAKQIGSDSVEGYAMKTSLSSDSDLFVIKTPRNPKKDELVHEALIGFYALNKLRHILPNYMYVYGYTKCSPPVLDNRDPITWCSSTTPSVSYLITENIKNSVSIGEFVSDPNTGSNDFLAVFLQLINALNLAYKSYGYTHYDLHTKNVMVRKYNHIVAIPYFGTSNKIIGYIATQYVPYIIDYGYSRITVGNVGFGKIGLEGSGIEGKRAFPMFDVYKIIGFMGESIYTSPRTDNYKSISDLLDGLFSFFKEGSLLDRVKKRLSGKRDWYAPNLTYRDITHDTYIDWLQSKSEIGTLVHTNLAFLMENGVLTAPINTAMDTCTFYDMISNDSGPVTSLEYCDAVTAINQDNVLSSDIKQNAIKWLNERFDAETYFQDTIQQINNDVIEASILRFSNHVSDSEDIAVPRLSQLQNGENELSTVKFIDSYRNQIFQVLRVKELTSNLFSYIRANICALMTQHKLSKYKLELDKLSNIAAELVKFTQTNRAVLKQNVEYINKIKWDTSLPNKVSKFWKQEHEILFLAL